LWLRGKKEKKTLPLRTQSHKEYQKAKLTSYCYSRLCDKKRNLSFNFYLMYSNLSDREEYLGREIVYAAYKVHKELGPGLLEKVYEVCFCYELELKGIPTQRQVDLPISYKDKLFFEEGFRMDVLVDELVICELKSVQEIHPIWISQIISHLKLSQLRLGYLINFNVPLIKDGIKRFVV
jgi:GxxExxY protein